MFKQIRWHLRLGVLLFLTSGWLGFLITPTVAQAQTTLGKVAASMQPGTWATLNTNGDASGFSFALLDAGNGQTITQWTDKGAWDPVSRKFFFRGQGHIAAEKLIGYDDATNRWTTLQNLASGGFGHAYQTNTINPTARELYFRHYGTTRVVEKYNLNTGGWTSLPSNNLVGYPQCCIAIEYFPERNSLIWVNGQEFNPPNGGVYSYSFSTGQWSTIGNYPMGTYDTFASYNPVHKVILFGGDTNVIHKLDQNGNVTRLNNAPIDLGIYKSVTTVDPVSGKYIILGANRSFYEYDVVTDTWRLLGGTVPAFSSMNPPVFDVIAAPISTYGVIMFVTTNYTSSAVYLYKHATGSGTPPPSSTFDFSVSNGGSKSVTQGQPTSNTVTATLVSGTAQAAGFSVSGLPSGATGTFTQTSCLPTCSTTLNISTLSTTATGNYTVNVASVAGSLTRSSQFTLTVNASSTTPPTSTLDFQTRCSQPGVVKCVGFDQASDLSGTYGANSGIMSGATTPAFDTSVKASGNGSIKFTIPSNSGSDTSGSYFTNFSSDLSTQFGENSEFYVQWRQRFSPEMLSTFYLGSGGFKHGIISTGDQPGKLYATCTALEVVMNQYYQNGFPVMYNSCTGSTSHGAYDGFYQRFGTFDFKLQNARPSPYCLYSQQSTNPPSFLPPAGNCFGYFANEWMTYQVMIKTGPRVGNEFTNSYVKLWIARDGQPSQLAIDWGPYNLSAGSATENQRYGKVWLLPYQTGKNSSQSHPTAYTWYDELIISRSKIADPSAGGGTVTTPPAAPTALILQ